MTSYVLEQAESRGVYYVADFPPMSPDQRHHVSLTNVRPCARHFEFMSAASMAAATLPGRWRVLPVDDAQEVR